MMKKNFEGAALATNMLNEDAVKVGVHNGVFHADDVLCVAMLRTIYGTENVSVIRSRNPQALAACDYVLDVGGQDLVTPERVSFDHHGGEAPATVRENGVKSAACGKLADWLFAGQPWLPQLHAVLLDGVEAVDNGQDPIQLGLRPSPIDFVRFFVPQWDEAESMDEAFGRAVEAVQAVFERILQGFFSKAAAAARVEAALAEAKDGVVTLPCFLPWQEGVVAYNQDHPADQVRLVVYPAMGGRFNVQTVPVALGKFGALVDLPESWAGKQGGELEAVTGIPGAVFCHMGRFMASFETLEGAQEAARKALKEGGCV